MADENDGFLVLTRREGEAVVMGKGGEIEVTVLGYNGKGTVRLGVKAPKDVPVDRKEIYERKVLGVKPGATEEEVRNRRNALRRIGGAR